MLKPLPNTGIARLARVLAVSLVTTIATVPAASWAQQQALPNVIQLETEEEAIRRYSVEVIIFEYAGAAANTTEIFAPEQPPEVPVFADEGANPDAAPVVFSDRPLAPEPDDPPPIATEPAGDDALMPEAGEEQPFVLLPGEILEEIPTYENAGIESVDPADYQLTSAWQRLDALDAYRPLMHTAWIQPTVEKDETKPLTLRRIGDPPLRLNGEFTLYLSRFLHLVVDLSLEERPTPGPAATPERVRYYGDSQSQAAFSFGSDFAQPPTLYRINEDRIVRNNEVRYYDHPKFGVIARITRIEEALPEDPDTTGDLLPGNPVQ